MSIVVTCNCEMTYRLPNKYAGKRCRCRECGEKIRVPGDRPEAKKKKKRSKGKERKEARDRGRRGHRRTGVRLASARQTLAASARPALRALVHVAQDEPRQREQDEARVDVPQLDQLARLGGLDRGERAAGELPVREVRQEDEVHPDQAPQPPARARRPG